MTLRDEADLGGSATTTVRQLWRDCQLSGLVKQFYLQQRRKHSGIYIRMSKIPSTQYQPGTYKNSDQKGSFARYTDRQLEQASTGEENSQQPFSVTRIGRQKDHDWGISIHGSSRNNLARTKNCEQTFLRPRKTKLDKTISCGNSRNMIRSDRFGTFWQD